MFNSLKKSLCFLVKYLIIDKNEIRIDRLIITNDVFINNIIVSNFVIMLFCT